jgi:hypothetical protein
MFYSSMETIIITIADTLAVVSIVFGLISMKRG